MRVELTESTKELHSSPITKEDFHRLLKENFMQINSIIEKWKIVKLDILELEYNFDESFLVEDMFQIQHNDYVVDSGWYGSQNVFVTYLIYKQDWENPVVLIKSISLQHCLYAIELTINYANKIIKGA